jgi:hypothetical protein
VPRSPAFAVRRGIASTNVRVSASRSGSRRSGESRTYADTQRLAVNNSCSRACTGRAHARAIIEDWQRENNDQRSKKALGGLTPACAGS